MADNKIPAKLPLLHFTKRVVDHRVKSALQPKVTVTFTQEVAIGGKLFAAGSTHDIPLDMAHSLHRFIKKG